MNFFQLPGYGILEDELSSGSYYSGNPHRIKNAAPMSPGSVGDS